MPVQSFTPTKNFPSFSGLVNQVYTPANYTGSVGVSFLPTDVLGGFIVHDATAAVTDTLPSASALVPLIQGAQVGSAIRFFVKNSGGFPITLAAGAGGTLDGTAAIPTVEIRDILLIVTALPDQFGNGATYTAHTLGASAY